MQQVKASCPTCADVTLAPGDVSVVKNGIAPELSRYTFTCPGCGESITKPASPEVFRLLMLVTGVRWNVVHVPAELSEAYYVGPALTEQDVADFVIDMNLTPDHLLSILAGGDK